MKFPGKELSPVETSFLKWQYGFDEADEPFEQALWQAIMRGWLADHSAGSVTRHLARLGGAGVYPEEVALYVRFKADDSDAVWKDLIRRAGLSDRRSAKLNIAIDRRRRAVKVA
jgi:proline dehydrogenase